MSWDVLASAPGKLILFGEHAVVHEEPAVATAVSLRTHCGVRRVKEKRGESLEVHLLSVDAERAWKFSWEGAALDELRAALGPLSRAQMPLDLSDARRVALLRASEAAAAHASALGSGPVKGLAALLLLYLLATGESRGDSIECHVWSTLPVGAGLGSSAAFSAAVCGALMRLAGVSATKEELNVWTYQAERVLHGNPSGIDNSIAIFGGALSFVRGQGSTPIEHMPTLPLVLTDTGVARSTQKAVAGVGQRKERFPTVMEPTLNAMGAISRKAMELFEGETDQEMLQAGVGELMEMNQGLLECIGVSHESIRRVVNAAVPFGFPTKLTGAGAGGCVVSLVTRADHQAAFTSAIESLGMTTYNVQVGGPGLLWH